MKIPFLYLSMIIVFQLLTCQIIFGQKKQAAVLVFSKTVEYRHLAIEVGKKAIIELGEKNGFQVDTTEDASKFNWQYLSKFDAVVFLNTTGDVLNSDQEKEFQRFIRSGGGFVGIHAATDTEHQWSWYGNLVGAYFNGHPDNPNIRDAKIDVLLEDHPSTRGVPKRWHCTDEWYNYKTINNNITVLMNLDETSYEDGNMGKSHPISWCHEYDGGRAWYTGRGHTFESYYEPIFLSNLLGGIHYAVNK